MSLPYLYSLQHCPYAMRARLGLLLSEQKVMVRAVNLKDKPKDMLAVSAKGTVPILVIPDEHDAASQQVIDESLDVMLWALHTSDPKDLLYKDDAAAELKMLVLIKKNDDVFVEFLEKYKHASRYHDFSQLYYRRQCELFIQEIEDALSAHEFIFGPKASLVDYALLPFIRQFAKVDRKWYLNSPYPNVRAWLNAQLQQALFTKAMAKFPLWNDEGKAYLLGSTV